MTDQATMAINDNPVTGFLHWRCLRCGRWTLDRWTAHACENGRSTDA